MALCVVQALAISYLFDFSPGIPGWRSPVFYLRELVIWLLLSGVAFGVLSWPQRGEIAALWRGEQARHNWRLALAVNLGLFAALALATVAFTAHAAAAPSPPWRWFWIYTIPLAATAISLVRVDLSITALCRLGLRYKALVAAAGGLGFLVLLCGALALDGWDVLAGATLHVTKGLLELYESGVTLDANDRLLTVKDFSVRIDNTCSGYEGMGLVSAFLALYLWAFRNRLRFPQALVLLPLGLGAIWLLNSVRIAALVSLGAHVSQDMAVRGFHSQAGWIAFLAVTVGIMAIAHKAPFMRAGGRNPAKANSVGDRTILAYLVPFIALMLASMVMAAAAPHDRPLYVLKVAAVGLALWLFRDVYKGWSWQVSPMSVLTGLVVAAAWIATDPAPASGSELRLWLEGQGGYVAALWLTMRVLGATVMVPISEELAFRGFLHRRLIARDFNSIPVGQVSLLAFAISSLLFGIMHERWIAGTLSGAAFAILMYRTHRLSDPIAAHMTANAVICAWAIGLGQWSLL